MSAQARWYLNGVDVYATYGVGVMEGNVLFLAYPKRKESLNHNWQEENNLDIDLNTPRFDAKEVKLRCWFDAPNEDIYWANRESFFAALTAPGWQVWRIADHQRDYSVFYKESSNFDFKTKRLAGNDNIVITFDLTLVVADSIQVNDLPSGDPVIIQTLSGAIVDSVVPGGTYTLPSISLIDGGDSSGDAQFSPINGLLDGN